MEEMPKNYDPSTNEPAILQKWLDGGYYKRREGVGDCTVTIPPPNVTGKLHMGHATDDSIQDAIIRMARMRGKSTRWVLGTDHAGIATQTKVDKKLKSEGISRLEIGRDKFVDACWDWTHEYGGIIVEQIKRMGCSVDFDNERFTMDEDYAQAVRKVFCDWYHDGLIYRGKRIVNWCPNCTTAISDDEAEYKDEKGHLWHLRYPLTEPVNGQDYIVVATTRPETMLGDTGVAVSPKDPEKAAFVGKTVKLPIVDREIPIFEDWHVDANFGSGFVKVTPAHDPNDYAMGQAHDLPQINIFDEHAVVVEGYGEFTGMNRDECREAVIKWFEEHDLLDHVEELDHSVMHCYRCDSALESWLSEQWFVAVDKLKGPALDAVNSGKVTFHPARWTQTYTTWMENLKDWCISRQLWWGHRIPVFYCEDCGWEDALTEDTDVCPKCGGHHVHQDENVLDTWFSSQLWTFATQGWPQKPELLEGHHPTTALVTARDIIALWVARMVMSSLYFLDEVPFKDVVIYPTILAKDGSRMSKSKGNGVDPMDLIGMYGADAMRYNLLTLCTNNQDVKFDANIDKKTKKLIESPRTEQAKSFVTKIWNASRFVMMNLTIDHVELPKKLELEDKWILSKLNTLIREVTDNMDAFELGVASAKIYDFIWDNYCDWFIELTKNRLNSDDQTTRENAQNVLCYVLILHPFMPFITEEIWQALPHEGEFLMLSKWPEYNEKFSFPAEEEAMQTVIEAITAIRARRNEMNVAPSKKVHYTVATAHADTFSAGIPFFTRLASASDVTIVPADAAIDADGKVEVDTHAARIFMPLAELVDFEKELARIAKEKANAEKQLAGIENKLKNEGFLAKAPEAVVNGARADAEKLRALIEKLDASAAAMKK